MALTTVALCAGSAAARSLDNVGVVFVEQMSVGAMGFGGVVRVRPPHIFSVRDWLQVARVNALVNPTFVVQLRTFRYRAYM